MLHSRSDDSNKALRFKLIEPVEVKLVVDRKREVDQVIRLEGKAN
jgi:hypothetical protein